MSPFLIGLVGLVFVLLFLALRVPVGISLAIVSVGGIAYLKGLNAAMGALESVPFDFTAHWTLSSIPMFLLMGSIASGAGMTTNLFAAMRQWLSWLPGGLAVTTTFTGAGFAAASGSSLATTATLGRTAVPEMIRFGYDPALATGVAASVGTLGAVIPPSIVIVLFAVFAEAPIGPLLIAGVLPGILTALVYSGVIVARCVANPRLAPRTERSRLSVAEHLRLLLSIWPLPFLVIIVMGGIYAGVATVTEAGALGVLAATLLALLSGKLTWRLIVDSLVETAVATAGLVMIVVGAALFTRFLALSGIPPAITAFILSNDPSTLMIILGIAVVYLVLGCFLDPVGILLLTLPVLLPVFEAGNINMIWMGILLVKFIEIGMLTPPVGLNVYVMKGVVGNSVSLVTIFKGVAWFLFAEAIVMSLLIAFPDITLTLPGLME